MYPSQTSLIPVTVAITRFLETNGFSSFNMEYPFWYLGVPFRYLSGPIVPVVIDILHKLFPSLSLFDLSFVLIAISFAASVVGWTLLIRKFQISNFKFQIFFVVLLLILPWRYFASLTLMEGSNVIARNLVPFSLIFFWNYLKKKNQKSAVLAVLSFSAILLISVNVLTIIFIGIIALALAKSLSKGKFVSAGQNLRKSLIVMTGSVLVSTLWYTPAFWWTILTNPSIGGKSGFQAIFRVFDLVKVALPVGLAIVSVYYAGKVRKKLSAFVMIWTFSFLFLSLFRFISDYDFWTDWSSWFFEIEIGIALLLSIIISNLFNARNFQFEIFNLHLKSHTTYYILLTTIFILPFYLVWRFHLVLDKPKLINDNPPSFTNSIKELERVSDGRRVFISGSSVFWANAVTNVNQVRGGNDMVATHPNWNRGAYTLRESSDPVSVLEWLDDLDIEFVLVHTASSSEYYHDFNNVKLWQRIGEKVWEEDGDIIYRVNSEAY